MNKEKWSFPGNEQDKNRIKSAIDSTYAIYAQIESEKHNLNDIYNELKEKYKMPRRVFNFLSKANYSNNQDEMFQKNDELREVWEDYSNQAN